MNLRKPVSTAIAAAVGSVLSLTTLVAAQGATQSVPDNPPAFEELDKNKDGTVTMTEAKDSWLAATFSSVDLNRDGAISKAEYQRAVG